MAKPTFFAIGKERITQYLYTHCLKKVHFSALWRIWLYIRQMIPSAVRRIFLLPPTALILHKIGRDPFHQQGGVFSWKIGWEWGKIPTWWEKSLHGNGKRAEKNPTWSEKFRQKRWGGVRTGIINQTMRT